MRAFPRGPSRLTFLKRFLYAIKVCGRLPFDFYKPLRVEEETRALARRWLRTFPTTSMRLSHLLHLRQKTPRERGVTRRRSTGPFCQSGNRTLSLRTPPAEKWERRKRCRVRMRGATRAPPGGKMMSSAVVWSARSESTSQSAGAWTGERCGSAAAWCSLPGQPGGLAGRACSNLSTPPGNSPNSLPRFPNHTISLQVQWNTHF